MEIFNDVGYLFLKKVYDDKTINNYNQLINQFWVNNNIDSHIHKKYDVEMENFIVNNTYSKLNNFIKQQYYYLPVIDNRYGHDKVVDAGMIDIFNIQKLIPETLEYFNTDVMISILQKITNKKWKFFRVNLQICNNVSNANSYHFDNTDNIIKFSIYLSEIDTNDKGALVYIENTHINKKNFKNKDIKIFLGNPGDLLISHQSGFHKKTNQKNSISNYLVFNFIEK